MHVHRALCRSAIHRGALTILSGAFDVPPALLEDGNVIVVSINYRLAVLGFFAHPALVLNGYWSFRCDDFNSGESGLAQREAMNSVDRNRWLPHHVRSDP